MRHRLTGLNLLHSMQYQHKILSNQKILLHVGNRARSYGKNLNLHSKSAFFKIVVTGFLLIKQPLFLDLDERHQLVFSSWSILTNVQDFALGLPLGLPLFFQNFALQFLQSRLLFRFSFLFLPWSKTVQTLFAPSVKLLWVEPLWTTVRTEFMLGHRVGFSNDSELRLCRPLFWWCFLTRLYGPFFSMLCANCTVLLHGCLLVFLENNETSEFDLRSNWLIFYSDNFLSEGRGDELY